MARWIPAAERASATGITEAGGPLGALLALFVTPVMAEYFGWRLALAVAAVCTLAFAALWFAMMCDGPDSCRYITEEEKKELQGCGLGNAKANGRSIEGNDKKECSHQSAASWHILLFSPAWAVFMAHCCFNYSRYLLYNWILTYYTESLQVSVAVAGTYMFWPNFVDGVISLLAGRAADALTNSGTLSIVAIRRLVTIVAFLGTGMGAVMLTAAEGLAATTFWLTLTAGLQALHGAGFKSSYADLSTANSGLLRGVGNMIGTAATFAVPLLAASLLEWGGGPQQKAAWQVVFGSVLACNIVGVLVFVPLISADSLDAKLKSD